MLKPNLGELTFLCGRELETSDIGIVKAATELIEQGVELVAVSLGRRGVIVLERQRFTAWKAAIDIGMSSRTAGVGSGDALVAAFAASALQHLSLDQAIRLGVACGAANLLTRAPGRFNLHDVMAFMPQVELTRIDWPTGRPAVKSVRAGS
jgi:fructose-1-phosphate kinase PfkB-like protein